MYLICISYDISFKMDGKKLVSESQLIGKPGAHTTCRSQASRRLWLTNGGSCLLFDCTCPFILRALGL